MKKRIFFILIIVFMAMSILFIVKGKNKEPRNVEEVIILAEKVEDKNKGILDGVIIVLDPGHGGKDRGATGENGTLEKNITLDTVQRLKDQLEQIGAEIHLTRSGDDFIDLDARIEMTIKRQADLFISVHYDGFEMKEVRGITSYYYHKKDEKLAAYIHDSIFTKTIETRNRGISHGDYFVLRENTVPAILLELGYITNKEDEKLINSEAFQQRVTSGVVEGIIQFFTDQSRESVTVKK